MNMTHFYGERELATEETSQYDGALRFTDELRRAVNAARKDPNYRPFKVVHELQLLATQEPPSHQAQYILDELKLPKFPQIPHQEYDTLVGEAWKNPSPEAAQLSLKSTGIILHDALERE